MTTTYQVIDGQTKQVIGEYSSRNRARNKAERLDLEYGAYRYFVRTVAPEHKDMDASFGR